MKIGIRSKRTDRTSVTPLSFEEVSLFCHPNLIMVPKSKKYISAVQTVCLGLMISKKAAQTTMQDPSVSGQPKGSDRNRALLATPDTISPVSKNDMVVGLSLRADHSVAIKTGVM